MEVFASLLYLVLDDSKNYGKWLHSAFPDITDSTRKIFINLIKHRWRREQGVKKI